ncbi:MAG: nucleotidyltransferase domain-containing protein, partial [Nitrosopumilus sp.]|nr:nucleotidyltransferase domain-containing protein [Nitrosopumilus sp.]
GREYDFTIFGIVKYFQLCMDGNPNIIDFTFIPQSCVLHITNIGNMIRDNRHMFLGKHMWPKFKGYSYSQLHKASGKNPKVGSKRHALREKHGFDSKYLYHVVRLLSEIEQILTTEDLDLQEKGRREHMKAIRRGDVSEEDIRKWASEKEHLLETLYHNSNIRQKPDEVAIRQLLINCLEEHYGSIKDCVAQIGWAEESLKKIDLVLDGIRRDLYK